MENPALCDADRITINAHAFSDGNVQATNAGNFIKDTVLPRVNITAFEASDATWKSVSDNEKSKSFMQLLI